MITRLMVCNIEVPNNLIFVAVFLSQTSTSRGHVDAAEPEVLEAWEEFVIDVPLESYP